MAIALTAVWTQDLGNHGREIGAVRLAVFCDEDQDLPVHAESFARPFSRITPVQRAAIERRAFAQARQFLAACN